MKYFIIVYLILIIYPKSFAAIHSSDSLKILEIIVIGNQKTKDNVIKREMKTKVGNYLNLATLDEDRKRIYNLRLFNRVKVRPVRSEQGMVILVLVSERWYVFPYPILYYNEKNVKRLSYGLGLVHQNFRGRASVLDGAGWLGYNPGFRLFYNNPWIGQSLQLFLQIQVFSYKIKSKNIKYDRFNTNQRGFLLNLGKRLGYHSYFHLSAGFRRIEFPERYTFLTKSKTSIDKLPVIGFSFKYDKRDLHQYPKRGMYAKFYIDHTLHPDRINYTRYGQDLRVYMPLYKGISIGSRLSLDLSDNKMPEYDYYHIGYLESIRGRFNMKMQGTRRFLYSSELRFSLLPIRYFNLAPSIPELSGYFNNLPFGISGALFYDTGVAWNNGILPTSDTFISGFGYGLHIHLPYIELIRIDHAFNQDGDSQFIVDIGVWF